MEEKVVDLNKFKFEEKKRKVIGKISDTYQKAKGWVVEHPAESVTVVTSIIGATSGLVKRADRKRDIKEVQKLKEEYIYDRSIGTYWKTRRPRTSAENLEIERRRRSGEPMGQILRDMRLL